MSEQNFKSKLAKYIYASDLDWDRKELWYLFMMKSTPEEDEAVYQAVTESKENLLLLTGHLRDKIFTMQGLTEDEWRRITNDEMQFSQHAE